MSETPLTTPFYDKDLIDILALEIPEPPRHAVNFLDVSGCRYHEGTITYIYAYFLDRERNPKLSDLFVQSLQELIQSKLKEPIPFEFDNLSCQLEYTIPSGNRIDLIISSTPSDRFWSVIKHHSAIVIENKILSPLKNELADYYRSIEADNKIGVLLTLHPHPIPTGINGLFINILHHEWLEKVKSKGLPSLLTTNEYVYLNDFFNNMSQITNVSNLTPEIKFFFDHTNKILKANALLEATREFILAQLTLLAGKSEGKLSGSNDTFRYMSKKDSAYLYFTIVFGDLLTTDPKVTIYLEVYAKGLKHQPELLEKLRKECMYQNIKENKFTDYDYAYLADQTYRPSKADLEDLSGYLYAHLERDFMAAYYVAAKCLDSLL
jgi:hypothetical protein